MKFASDTSAFSINTMLVHLGPKIHGGLFFSVGLVRKLVRGRWIIGKGAIMLFAIRSWLAWMMMMK